MKKLSALLLAVAVSIAAFAGCAPAASKAASTVASGASKAASAIASTGNLSGKVSTNGSTSVEKVIQILSESFMGTNKGVTVTYDPTGSSGGIKAANEGNADIGLSSRKLKDTEKGLKSVTFAIDGIAIIVNKANPIADLSLEQLKKIATGEVTDWSALGGKGPIVIIGREAGSGTRDGFESIVGVEGKVKYAQELPATGGVVAAVVANPNAIGYASLSAVTDTVKAVTIEKVAPTEATVQDGTYKVQRPFIFVLKEGKELSPAAKAFLDFATSPAAADLIKKGGAVPPKK